jgi:hypothetical protein
LAINLTELLTNGAAQESRPGTSFGWSLHGSSLNPNDAHEAFPEIAIAVTGWDLMGETLMRVRELSTLIDMPGKVETKSASLNMGGHDVRWRICGGRARREISVNTD